MFEVENTRSCDAPIGRVWRVVTDFGSYAEWRPSFSMSGTANDGAKLEITFRAGPGFLRALKTDAQVTRLERPLTIAWRIGIRGLLQIEHGFDLTKAGSGTRVRHWMRCGGILSRLWAKTALGKSQNNLAVANACLSAFLRRATTISRYAPTRGWSH